MVTLKNVFCLLVLATWVLISFGAQAESQKGKRPALIHFAIEGHSQTGEDATFCARFRLTEADVRRYLLTMKSAREMLIHELYSPCAAYGSVEFAGGDKGSFVIKSSGFGWVDTSRRGDRTVFAEPKWNDPFAGGYGLGD